ncbi:hypothetical protein ACFVSK_11345 [Cellulosimicrobium cellulans]|uniref:hypothetical protein n=1 Tax=Cellulosimicrobium cellulans TaxID=1710 RepID=UPI0036E2B533
MSTETAAAAELMRVMSRCPHLEPVFATHDRVPLTDGHIDIYSSKNKSNKTWLGRVDVQIKGRTSTKKKKKKSGRSSSYSLKREVLEAHQKKGGVLLLCVDLDLNRDKHISHYAALTPYEIRRILASIPEGQGSVAIPLAKLPRLTESLERLVNVVFVGTRQNPFAHTDPRLFETVKHFTLSTVEDIDLKAPMTFRQGESVFAVEVTTEDGSRVPLDGDFEILPHDYMPRVKDVQVTAGDALFERFTVQRMAPDELVIKLGSGLSLSIYHNGPRKALINVTEQSNFAARKRDLEFMIGVAESGEIRFGDDAFNLDPVPSDQRPRVDAMREHLAFLRRTQRLFDKFGVDSTLIEFDDLDDLAFRNLRALYNIFIEGARPEHSSGETGRTLVNFGPWAVMVVVVRDGNGDSWRYIDPFDLSSPQMFRWAAQDEREVTVPVTAYDIVEAEYLPKVLNLRLESIDTAYEAIAQADSTPMVANQCVRDLLSCSDAGGPRSEEFLRGAERLNEWIIRRDGEEETHLLNRWQIAWRTDSLTDTDLVRIREIKRASAQSADEMAIHRELACALLLRDRDESVFLTDRLTADQRTVIETWPIWELYRQLVEQGG